MSEIKEPAAPEGGEVDSDVWASLKRARETLGLTVGDVSAHLKLTVRQIEAIERGNVSVLPGAAFARGFVRNYARFLGLDPSVFLQAMEARAAGDGDVLAVRMNPAGLGPMPFKGSGRFASLPMVIGVLALLALLSLGAYFKWFESRDEDLLAQLPSEIVSSDASGVPSPAVSPVPKTQVVAASAPVAVSLATAQVSVPSASAQSAVLTQSAPSSSAQSVPANAQSVTVVRQSVPLGPVPTASQSQSNSNGAGLLLTFEGDSWVDVRDATGKPLLSRLNPAGSSQSLQGVPPFTLVVGNAGKVKLMWRGKAVDLKPYTKIDVARLSLQ